MSNRNSEPHKPVGKTVCPKVSLRCAIAINKILRYYLDENVKDGPTRDDENVARSFNKNLHYKIEAVKRSIARRSKHEAQEKDEELKRLIEEQEQDAEETGHGE